MTKDSGSDSWFSTLRSLLAWSLSLLGLTWFMGAVLGKKKKKVTSAAVQSQPSKQAAMQAQAEQLTPIRDRIEATLYGNCIGDAIGLLTEFMNKKEAWHHYGKYKGNLEFEHKFDDFHRSRWVIGDWTDDSDQMILILQSLCDNKGQAKQADFGKKLKKWIYHGFEELGDQGGCGIGATTYSVVRHEKYDKYPAKAAKEVWLNSNRRAAPNGGVMRTSVVGAYKFHDLDTVKENTLAFCKVTHADPRCQASCVAVTTAIALMLQGKHKSDDGGQFDVEAIIADSLQHAIDCMDDKDEDYDRNVAELKRHIYAESLDDLYLDEGDKIGYTYKCMGAGFWALRQTDFREALEAITYEAGDADTNGAVAGALLGCKLGKKGLPASWLKGLANQEWLRKQMETYIQLVFSAAEIQTPKDNVAVESETPEQNTNSSSGQQHKKPKLQRNEAEEGQQRTPALESKYDSAKYQAVSNNTAASPHTDDDKTEDDRQDIAQAPDGDTSEQIQQPSATSAVDTDEIHQNKGLGKEKENNQADIESTAF